MHIGKERKFPRTIRVDNGPEFISKVLNQWAYLNGVKLDFNRPGKPTDNGLIEAFNGRLRQERLNESWFLSLEGTRNKYNHGASSIIRNGRMVHWEIWLPQNMRR